MKLNFNEISSFVGDIFPLTCVDYSLTEENFTWKCDSNEVLFLKTLDFSNGCVIALLKEGTTTVTVTHGDEKTVCTVNVRKRKEYAGGKLNRYFADLHTHTSMNHNMNTFVLRDESEWAKNSLDEVRNEGFLDAMAVTDHGCLVNDLEFFRTLLAGKEFETEKFITFPGTESEVSEIETDKWGIKRKNSGEVVTFNACGYANTKTWQEYFERSEGNPFTVGGFAHPQIYGTPASSAPGIWNFCFETKTTDAHLKRFKFVELGNGEDRGSNLINDGVYSLALDCGYKVAPTMDSDCHETPWGKKAQPGRTVIYASEKSHETFLDAILNNRMYATESGDVDLFVTVNSQIAGGTVPATDKYDFTVKISSFGENKEPKHLDVISDGGKKVFECVAHYGEIKFTLTSDTASYFYVVLTDEAGLRTWSAPIYTGRKPRFSYRNDTGLNKIENVKCLESEKVTNGDPYDSYLAESPVKTLNFDLGKTDNVKLLGYYPHLSAYGEPVGQSMSQETQSRFIKNMEILTSDDGVTFVPYSKEIFRAYGGEQFVKLDTECRYVQINISSVGHELLHRGYEDQPVQVGEITFYK